MRYILNAIVIAAVLLLSATAEAKSKKLALDCQFNRYKFGNHLFVCPALVDGKGVHGFFGNTEKHLNAIYGRHVFTLSVNAQLDFFQTPVEVGREVTAQLTKGRQYQTTGKMEGDRVSVWISDLATGQRVSSVSSFTVINCHPIGCLPWKRIRD